MSKTETHWREFHETDYLGAHDLVADGVKEVNLKITSAQKQTVKDQNGKNEVCLVCNFEGSKPMILNATNCKAIEKVASTPFIENWKGTTVSIYILEGIKAFGKVVDGLRIKEFAPKIVIPQEEIDSDIKNLIACKNLEELKVAYPLCKHRNNAQVVAKKDELKNTLL